MSCSNSVLSCMRTVTSIVLLLLCETGVALQLHASPVNKRVCSKLDIKFSMLGGRWALATPRQHCFLVRPPPSPSLCPLGSRALEAASDIWPAWPTDETIVAPPASSVDQQAGVTQASVSEVLLFSASGFYVTSLAASTSRSRLHEARVARAGCIV